MIALPSYIDPELWAAFVESRAAMKVPFTQAAQKLVVRKLMGFHNDGFDPNKSLEKSAIYGYRGVFPVEKYATKRDEKDPELLKIDRERALATPAPQSLLDLKARLKREAA